jgi:hypothetical protein
MPDAWDQGSSIVGASTPDAWDPNSSVLRRPMETMLVNSTFISESKFGLIEVAGVNP